MSDDRQALIRHLRRHHPNLLDTTISWSDLRTRLAANEGMGFSSGVLPDAGLSDLPTVMLEMAHRAAHAGLYFQHHEDDWLCRDHDEEVQRQRDERGWDAYAQRHREQE